MVAMMKCRFLAAVLGLVWIVGAHAGNGVPPELIQYKRWDNTKPNVLTVVSGQMVRTGYWFLASSFTFNVSWVNAGRQIEPIRKQLCDLLSRAQDNRCIGIDKPRFLIEELFLGPAADFQPSPVSDASRIGTQSLANIPAGAKKVLYLRVTQPNQPAKEVFSASFDDNTPDDDLRQIALEDGVLRVLRFRED